MANGPMSCLIIRQHRSTTIRVQSRVRARIAMVLVVLVGGSCRPRPAIDLRCDQLEWVGRERGADVSLIAGASVDSAIRAAGVGRLVAIARTRADSAPLAEAVSVGMRSTGVPEWSYSSTSSVHPTPVGIEQRAGEYEWRTRCLHCWTATGRHKIVAGHTDTLMLFLGQARVACDR